MSSIVVLTDRENWIPEITYAFRSLLEPSGWRLRVEPLGSSLSTPSPTIIYADVAPFEPKGRHLQIRPCAYFWDNFLKDSSLPKTPLRRIGESPVLYGGNELSLQENVVRTDFDIVASTLFMLSRYEEYLSKDRDQHDRFSLNASVLKESSLTRLPIVDLYRRLIQGWCDTIFPESQSARNPTEAQFSYTLTHDIDHLQLFGNIKSEIRTIASILYRRKSPLTAARLIGAGLTTRAGRRDDPYDTMNYLMDLSEEYDAKSLFFFMTAKECSRDGGYESNSPLLSRTIRQVINRGHAVGLHGSYLSHCDPVKLRDQKRTLERLSDQDVKSTRQHYLRFRVPNSWRAQSEAGFDNDYTLGYAEEIGFRSGTAFPFRPFDLERRTEMPVLEHSTTIMDVSLSEKHYLGLTPDQALEQCVGVVDQVKRVRGHLVLLWHNSSLSDLLSPGWRQCYEGLLEAIKVRGGRSGNPT